MSVRVIHGDCRIAIPELAAAGRQVDAIVTDPPYHLIQGSRGGSLRQNDPAKPFGRAEARGGFMGQAWDGGDIAFRPETWATMMPVLRPGGFLLAFGGTRTHHLVWCAIEDAGFVIQDTISWLYGSGFPKGRTQLKPAWEPIVVAYKPGGPRTLQIDECRIHTEGSSNRQRHGGGVGGTWSEFTQSTAHDKYDLPNGRWPANLCHDGSDEVIAAFPLRDVNVPSRKTSERSPNPSGNFGQPSTGPRFIQAYDDTGSAARFFYSNKAGADDRWGSRHPTVKPVELIKWLVALVTPPQGTVLDPFAGSGTTAVAGMATGRNVILIEREDEYIADMRERIAFYQGEGRHSLALKNRNAREHDKPGSLL